MSPCSIINMSTTLAFSLSQPRLPSHLKGRLKSLCSALFPLYTAVHTTPTAPTLFSSFSSPQKMARGLPQEQSPKAQVGPPTAQFPDCGPQARDSTKQPSVREFSRWHPYIHTRTISLSHTNKYKPSRLAQRRTLLSFPSLR